MQPDRTLQSFEPASLPMEPILIADHVALDMLNSLAAQNGAPLEFWNTDRDILRWLELTHLVPAGHRPADSWHPGTLLRSAKQLRDVVRDLVVRRKAGKRLDFAELNAFLAKGASHLQLHAHAAAAPRLERVYSVSTPEALLSPLAESAAELLAHADFELIRRCEGQDCVLWFYDRTKAHRRRWCSMGICGNRAKVAAFRQRQV